MGKDTRLTAAEAKKLAATSDFSLKNIYKCIREEAKRNVRSIMWTVYDYDETALSTLVETLKNDGYKCTLEETELRIEW